MAVGGMDAPAMENNTTLMSHVVITTRRRLHDLCSSSILYSVTFVQWYMISMAIQSLFSVRIN